MLSVEGSANSIVPFLRQKGYSVRYDEFEGGHFVHPAEAELAAQWFLGQVEQLVALSRMRAWRPRCREQPVTNVRSAYEL